jgi:hypothetical protein
MHAKPAWMHAGTYAMIPGDLELRELRYAIIAYGKLTKSKSVATTLTDLEESSKEDTPEAYDCRWSSDLDTRSVRNLLNLGHPRYRPPDMAFIVTHDGSA